MRLIYKEAAENDASLSKKIIIYYLMETLFTNDFPFPENLNK